MKHTRQSGLRSQPSNAVAKLGEGARRLPPSITSSALKLGQNLEGVEEVQKCLLLGPQMRRCRHIAQELSYNQFQTAAILVHQLGFVAEFLQNLKKRSRLTQK